MGNCLESRRREVTPCIVSMKFPELVQCSCLSCAPIRRREALEIVRWDIGERGADV
jgi:hypothetical protein